MKIVNMMAKSKVKLETLLEQLNNLGEEDKKVVREKLKIKDQKKLELDPQTYQTVLQVIQQVNRFLEKNKPGGMEKLEEESPNSNFEISFGLHNQKKIDLAGEKIKILQIWWKDKGKLKEIRRVKVPRGEN